MGHRAHRVRQRGPIEGHRTDTGRPTLTGFGRQSSIRPLSMDPAEVAAIGDMADGCLGFLARSNVLMQALSPIDQASQGLMSELHEGGGSHAY